MTDLSERVSSTRPVAPTPRLRALLTPVVFHYSILVIGLVVLLVEARSQWFFYDDWSFLIPSHVGLFQAHNGHWSTVPMLLFTATKSTFGLNSFYPFAIPAILAHLALAHLTWRVMRHIGTNAWVATLLSALIVFLGAGAENILWAFQVGFIGAIDLALCVLLLFMAPKNAWRSGLLYVLPLLAVATSGTSLPVLLGSALVGWRYRGFWRTALYLLPTAIVYAAWYIVFGRTDPNQPGRVHGLFQFVQYVPQFVLELLTSSVGALLGIGAVGAVVAVALFVWAAIRLPASPRIWTPAYACLLAAIVFAFLSADQRAMLGAASSSRYLYFVLVMYMPVASLAITVLVERAQLRSTKWVVAAILVAIIGFNGTLMVSFLHARAGQENYSRDRIHAAISIVTDKNEPSYSPTAQPEPQWAPDVKMSDLETLVRRGDIAPAPYSETALLSVKAHLFLDVVPVKASPPGSEKNTVLLQTDPPRQFSERFVYVYGRNSGTIQAQYVSGTSVGDLRTLSLHKGWNRIESSAQNATLQLSSPSLPVHILPAS
jgi:hypothetical protein